MSTTCRLTGNISLDPRISTNIDLHNTPVLGISLHGTYSSPAHVQFVFAYNVCIQRFPMCYLRNPPPVFSVLAKPTRLFPVSNTA